MAEPVSAPPPSSSTTSFAPDLPASSLSSRWDPAAAGSNAGANGHAHAHAQPAPAPVHLNPVPASILPGGRHSLGGVAVRAAGLGATAGVSACAVAALLAWGSPLWRVPFYAGALAAFHFLEFFTTAARNTGAASVRAFLLSSNGAAYNAAQAVAVAEAVAGHTLLRDSRWAGEGGRAAAVALGLALVAAGQAVRSAAMLQAGSNFNHTVQSHRRAGHVLVQRGVYRWLRHPSYFGFFWWALGSQLVLGNPVSFTGYAVVLWLFFRERIQKEEEFLVKFFGPEYVEYRGRTPVGIPFIS